MFSSAAFSSAAFSAKSIPSPTPARSSCRVRVAASVTAALLPIVGLAQPAHAVDGIVTAVVALPAGVSLTEHVGAYLVPQGTTPADNLEGGPLTSRRLNFGQVAPGTYRLEIIDHRSQDHEPQLGSFQSAPFTLTSGSTIDFGTIALLAPARLPVTVAWPRSVPAPQGVSASVVNESGSIVDTMLFEPGVTTTLTGLGYGTYTVVVNDFQGEGEASRYPSIYAGSVYTRAKALNITAPNPGALLAPISINYGAKVFTDVTIATQFAQAMGWMADQGITTGYGDGSYRPLANVNRDAMAAFLYRLAGKPAVNRATCPTFTDVPASYQFATEICWAAEVGITQGYGDRTFRPTSPVSREATAAFLYRYWTKVAGNEAFPRPAVAPFKDVPLSNPFVTEIHWLQARSITQGYGDGTFRPLGSVHRDAAAIFIQRLAWGM